MTSDYFSQKMTPLSHIRHCQNLKDPPFWLMSESSELFIKCYLHIHRLMDNLRKSTQYFHIN